jgi:Ca2+-binding RTX toxin-like protein
VKIDGVQTTLDAFAPGLDSLNPFDLPLTKINVLGKGSGDKITISSALTAQAKVWGGLGDDTITGGGGADWLYGEAGKDRLFGGKNNDRLDGGRDGKKDILRGQTGADTFVIH